MTAQEIFDRVWTHFVVEGNPRSLGNDGACKYRSSNGAKCAVGVLIPDEDYETWMDQSASMTAERVLGDARCPASLRKLKPHRSLLIALQNAHDADHSSSDEPSPRRVDPDGLRVVAKNFDLTIPEVSP
jgi:hypothetical protein